jgi:hypothetical protein
MLEELLAIADRVRALEMRLRQRTLTKPTSDQSP